MSFQQRGITDRYGLTLPNQYLQLHIPASNSAVVLYVKYRHNPNYSLVNYGPLPTTTTSSFSLYNGLAGGSGGTASPAGNGQMPASSWIKGINFQGQASLSSVSFNTSGTFPYGAGDIWYTQNQNRLFEVAIHMSPAWVRIGIDIPTSQNQQTMQDTVAGGVDQDFGWHRGKNFAAHIPFIHYGYDFGNDTNAAIYTRAFFRYAEQEVVLVKDPNLIFQIVNNIVPNHLVEMPIVQSQSAIQQGLQQAYGFNKTLGFPVYPRVQQARALQEYQKIVNELSPVQGVAQ